MEGVSSSNNVLMTTGIYSLKKVFELNKDLMQTLLQSAQDQNTLQTSTITKAKNATNVVDAKQGRVDLYV